MMFFSLCSVGVSVSVFLSLLCFLFFLLVFLCTFRLADVLVGWFSVSFFSLFAGKLFLSFKKLRTGKKSPAEDHLGRNDTQTVKRKGRIPYGSKNTNSEKRRKSRAEDCSSRLLAERAGFESSSRIETNTRKSVSAGSIRCTSPRTVHFGRRWVHPKRNG